MAIVQRSSRKFTVKPADNGDIIDMGPAATSHGVGTFAIQFIPDEDFVGEFAVLGRVFGQAAKEADAPFVQIPYRRVNVNGAASDYAISTALINDVGIIQVPANGLAIGLLTACSAGSCDVVSWDLMGPSAI